MQTHPKFIFNCDPASIFKSNSQYWAYFVEGYDQVTGMPSIACKFCAHVFQHPRAKAMRRAPTSTMKTHIEDGCKSMPRTKSNTPSMKTASGGFFGNGRQEALITQSDVEDQILRFFISGNIPFNQAENPEFRKLVSMIQLGKVSGAAAHPPSRFTVRRRLRSHSETAAENLFETFACLNSKVSLALDCWSTRNMLPFLGIHYPPES